MLVRAECMLIRVHVYMHAFVIVIHLILCILNRYAPVVPVLSIDRKPSTRNFITSPNLCMHGVGLATQIAPDKQGIYLPELQQTQYDANPCMLHSPANV